MANEHDRKEYRKSLTSSGQIFIGGEILEFKSYDVSVKGIMVEVYPGRFLTEIEDFEALLVENDSAEIFVEELRLTGSVEVVWVKQEADKILLGLEYRDVRHNEQKLWVQRAAYRQKKSFSCLLIYDHGRINARGIDISVIGLALTGDFKGSDIKTGDIVKLQLFSTPVNKAVAKIVWLKENDEGSTTLGLRYLEID
ncbi:PilZ domain-containing protein [Methylomarinum vadi]|uniref:PilZ domain-containing protein n=1 Tax=Methylomarinum vadi TaxID=438855 RepID=UPI0004DF0118|nr:PilZ domain-containing protein [Methylomarinum vadi]